VFLECNH